MIARNNYVGKGSSRWCSESELARVISFDHFDIHKKSLRRFRYAGCCQITNPEAADTEGSTWVLQARVPEPMCLGSGGRCLFKPVPHS